MAHANAHAVTKRRTLIKDRVGCVRTSSYDLPEHEFVYGRPSAPDPESCGDVISKWVPYTPSPTPPHMQHTRKGHKRSDGNAPPHQGPFGCKSESAGERIDSLVQAKFTNFDQDERDYPSVARINRQSRMAPPKTTRAAELAQQARENRGPVEHKPWTMKRFQNVKGKLREQLGLASSSSPRAAPATATPAADEAKEDAAPEQPETSADEA